MHQVLHINTSCKAFHTCRMEDDQLYKLFKVLQLELCPFSVGAESRVPVAPSSSSSFSSRYQRRRSTGSRDERYCSGKLYIYLTSSLRSYLYLHVVLQMCFSVNLSSRPLLALARLLKEQHLNQRHISAMLVRLYFVTPHSLECTTHTHITHSCAQNQLTLETSLLVLSCHLCYSAMTLMTLRVTVDDQLNSLLASGL